jgi:hypothetical protein
VFPCQLTGAIRYQCRSARDGPNAPARDFSSARGRKPGVGASFCDRARHRRLAPEEMAAPAPSLGPFFFKTPPLFRLSPYLAGMVLLRKDAVRYLSGPRCYTQGPDWR